MVVFDEVMDDDLGSTTSTTAAKQKRHIDLTFFSTLPGILKVVQWTLVVFLRSMPRPFFLSFVVEMSFILTTLWIIVYAFNLHKKYSISTPWIVLEFFYTVGAACLYLVATLVTFALMTYLFVAICAFLTTVAYGADAIFLLKSWTEWKTAQIGLSPEDGLEDGSGDRARRSSDYTNRQTLKI